MGYRITYEPQLAHKYPIRLKSSKHIRMICLIFVLLLCVITYTYKDNLTQLLISDHVAIAQEAFTCMIDSLQSGESFQDAATAFCLRVLENAG